MSYPDSYPSFIEAFYKEPWLGRLLNGFNALPETSLRINLGKKCTEYPLIDPLKVGRIPWLPHNMSGYYLSERPFFAHDPLWHIGGYYVQDASSMIVARMVEQLLSDLSKKNLVAVDLCAAPGGKTTILRDILPPEALVIANEIHPQRVQVLHENLLKWCGLQGIICTKSTPNLLSQALGEATVDLLLVDAPCSGEGLFRKDEQAIEMWSIENVMQCVVRQKEILYSAHRMLKPGGYLIYSTCTLNALENDEQVSFMQKEWNYRTIRIPLSEDEDVENICIGDNGGMHFFPGVVRGEGLYICLLQKPLLQSRDEEEPLLISRSVKAAKKSNKKGIKTSIKSTEKEFIPLSSQSPFASCCSWFWEDECLIPYEYNQSAFLLSGTEMKDVVNRLLSNRVHVLGAGIPLAEQKGKTIIPSWGLSMSRCLKRRLWTEVELSENDALEYLRTQAIAYNPVDEVEKGIVLLTYRGVPLGFANRVDNRLNNLYPKNYRLRM